jgi:hypothetical protein
MNGLPATIDWVFLIGRTLQQVAFGQYQLQLRFDGGIWIDVEGKVTIDGMSADAESLRGLVGVRIDSVGRKGPGDLVISLGGRSLTLHDSNEQYESYTIGAPGLHIVV